MEQWKIEEIRLLQSDIDQCLRQMGIDPVQITTMADLSSHGKAGSEDEVRYLNARFQRIAVLLNSAQK